MSQTQTPIVSTNNLMTQLNETNTFDDALIFINSNTVF